MAGDLYRAAQRTGGLKPVVDLFTDLEKKREQEEFYDAFLSAVHNFSQNQKQAEANEYKLTGEVTNPFKINTIPATMQSNIPNNRNPLAITETEYQPQTRQITQPEKYESAKEALNKFYNEVTPLLINQNLDQNQLNKINMIGELFGEQVEELKPKKLERTNIPRGALQILSDEYGNEVDRVENTADDRITTKLEGSYKNPKTGTYWKYDEISRQGVDTGIPYDQNEGRNTTNVNMPELPMDTSSLQSELTSASGNFKDFDKKSKEASKRMKQLEGDKESAEYIQAKKDYDTAQEQKEIYMNNIKGKSDAIANKLNSKYPGFEKIYNLSFQNPELKALQNYKPKNDDEEKRRTAAIERQINRLVEDEMKGADSDTKRWMKKALKSRIF